MHLTHRNRVGYSRQNSLECPSLRSPLSSGEGSVARIRLVQLSVKGCHNKPSPLERGDRSGASFGKARAKTRKAIAVGEIHHTNALTHLEKVAGT